MSSEWQKFFKEAGYWAYQAVYVPEGCEISALASMECFYQAFKARFLAEQAATESPKPEHALSVEENVVREALSELVKLKEYKDSYGKDELYEAKKDTAWLCAKTALQHPLRPPIPQAVIKQVVAAAIPFATGNKGYDAHSEARLAMALEALKPYLDGDKS